MGAALGSGGSPGSLGAPLHPWEQCRGLGAPLDPWEPPWHRSWREKDPPCQGFAPAQSPQDTEQTFPSPVLGTFSQSGLVLRCPLCSQPGPAVHQDL